MQLSQGLVALHMVRSSAQQCGAVVEQLLHSMMLQEGQVEGASTSQRIPSSLMEQSHATVLPAEHGMTATSMMRMADHHSERQLEGVLAEAFGLRSDVEATGMGRAL